MVWIWKENLDPWIFYSLVEIKNVIIFRSQCEQNCFVLSAFIFLSATWNRNSIIWNYCFPWFTPKNRGSAFWTMKWIIDMFDLSVEDCLLFFRVSLLLRSLRENVILWGAIIDWINTCFNPSYSWYSVFRYHFNLSALGIILRYFSHRKGLSY